MRAKTARFLHKLAKLKQLHTDNELKRYWRAMTHKQRGLFRAVIEPHLEKTDEVDG